MSELLPPYVPGSLTDEQTKFLESVDPSFRMVDLDGNVCQFLRHTWASSKVSVVKYPDGKTSVLQLRTEVSFFPFKWIPYHAGSKSSST